MTGDMTVSEGFAITAFAELIGVARDQALMAFLQIKSFFQANRNSYEIARARVVEGTPPTTKEALTGLAVVLAGAESLAILIAGQTTFATFETSAAAFLGFSATGIAPFLLGLGLAALCVILVWETALVSAQPRLMRVLMGSLLVR